MDGKSAKSAILKFFSQFPIRVPISRAILCAASEYFATMLVPHFDDSKCTEFIVKDVDAEKLRAIVKVCYTGYIELSEDNVNEFIAASSFYQIEWLQQKCYEFCSAALNVSNVVSMLVVADQFNLMKLRKEAFNLICGEFNSVPSTDMQQIEPQLLEDLLKSDTIQAPEDVIFGRLMEWYEYNTVDRRKLMANLIKCIRFNHLSGKFLIDKVVASCRNFNCSELVTEDYLKRSMNPSTNACCHRALQVYSVFHEDRNDRIHVEKYNSALGRFDFVTEISFPNRNVSQVISHENKLIICCWIHYPGNNANVLNFVSLNEIFLF